MEYSVKEETSLDVVLGLCTREIVTITCTPKELDLLRYALQTAVHRWSSKGYVADAEQLLKDLDSEPE